MFPEKPVEKIREYQRDLFTEQGTDIVVTFARIKIDSESSWMEWNSINERHTRSPL